MTNFEKGDSVSLHGDGNIHTIESICVLDVFRDFNSIKEAEPFIIDTNKVCLILTNGGGIGYNNAVLIKKA